MFILHLLLWTITYVLQVSDRCQKILFSHQNLQLFILFFFYRMTYTYVLRIQTVLAPGRGDAVVEVGARSSHIQLLLISLSGDIVPGLCSLGQELIKRERETLKMASERQLGGEKMENFKYSSLFWPEGRLWLHSAHNRTNMAAAWWWIMPPFLDKLNRFLTLIWIIAAQLNIFLRDLERHFLQVRVANLFSWVYRISAS